MYAHEGNEVKLYLYNASTKISTLHTWTSEVYLRCHKQSPCKARGAFFIHPFVVRTAPPCADQVLSTVSQDSCHVQGTSRGSHIYVACWSVCNCNQVFWLAKSVLDHLIVPFWSSWSVDCSLLKLFIAWLFPSEGLDLLIIPFWSSWSLDRSLLKLLIAWSFPSEALGRLIFSSIRSNCSHAFLICWF